MPKKKNNTRAWVVAVSMGYGHQRTAYPLRELAPDGKIISANDYEGMPEHDRFIWQESRGFYELMSRFQRFPIIGNAVFRVFDRFQRIMNFYPRRDMSEPTLALEQIHKLILKGWGKHLIKKLSADPIPLISTFFTPAFMADIHGYPGEIYCVVCDADVSRSWAPLEPQKSRIKYLAPTERAAERLEYYGVKKENIFLTGYPLPKENVGSAKLEIAKQDLGKRLMSLDPEKKFYKTHAALVKDYFGKSFYRPDGPITVMFSVGGAGAQKDIALKAANSLMPKIRSGEVKFIISAGIKSDVRKYFNENLDGNVEILYEANINDYFRKFNETLHSTDILWTKPSELSFYSSLGIPIIIAPPLGSQENFNRDWLLAKNSGILQNDPAYTSEWLSDFIKEGRFAEAAVEGFIETKKTGTFEIEKIISQSE
ncbi:MAG: hypothetical protein ABSF47_03645 [Minisyncoccia bacterium]|jgi:hypothetical protein